MEQTGILTKILSKNIDLSYLEKGVGPTIIFLHGISGNKEIWVPQLKIFSKQFRTISWDARGYGQSKPNKNSFSFGQFTSDLYYLIQHLELNKIILCGHSMGGRIALDFAEAHPSMVGSLILVNTFFGYDKSFTKTQRLGFLEKRKKLLIDDGLTLREFGEKIIPQMVGPNANSVVESKILETILTLNVESYLNTAESMVMYEKICDLASIDAPTLIITGSRDTISPPEISIQMNKRIKNSELLVVEEAGHFVNLESPKLFNEGVLDFLNKVRF